MTWNRVIPLVVIVAWCVGVFGLGYGLAERDEVSKRWHAGERDVVNTIRLFASKDSDEHLYHEYAGYMVGDPRVNRDYLARMHQVAPDIYPEASNQAFVPYRDFPVEYPPLALGVVLLPRLLVQDLESYRHVLGILMTVVLLMGVWGAKRVFRILTPEAGSAGTTSLLRWSLAMTMPLGYLVVTRFDVVPAALVIWGMVAILERRPVATGVLIGLGVGVKLWPIFLVPAILAWLWARGRLGEAVRFVVAGAVVVVGVHLPFLILAPDGLIAAYRYHSLRGLQLESLSANLILVARALGLVSAQVGSGHGAWEIWSPWSNLLATVEQWLMPLSILATAALVWVRTRAVVQAASGAEDRLLLTHVIATMAIIMVLSPVLSPQYLLWLMPLVLACGAGVPWIRRIFLVSAILTLVLYPHLYIFLRALNPAMVTVLTVRNVLLVFLTVVAFRASAVFGTLPTTSPRSAGATSTGRN